MNPNHELIEKLEKVRGYLGAVGGASHVEHQNLKWAERELDMLAELLKSGGEQREVDVITKDLIGNAVAKGASIACEKHPEIDSLDVYCASGYIMQEILNALKGVQINTKEGV